MDGDLVRLTELSHGGGELQRALSVLTEMLKTAATGSKPGITRRIRDRRRCRCL